MHKKRLLRTRILAISITASLLTPATAFAGPVNHEKTGSVAAASADNKTNTTVGDTPEDVTPPSNTVPPTDNQEPEVPVPTPPGDVEEPVEPEKPPVTIITDYTGKLWVAVEGGFAPCDADGNVIEGEIVAEIPKKPEEPATPPTLPTPPAETPAPEQTPETEPAAPEIEEPAPEEWAEAPRDPDAPTNNDGLIANQQIIIPPQIEESFRFVTVEKVFAVAKEDDIQVYEEKDDTKRAVGTLKKDGLCYVLKDEEDGWSYIESGVVRGFVKTDSLLTGDEAKVFVEEKKEENLTYAQALVDPFDNLALTYTKTTTRQTVVDKVYAISQAEGLNIREDRNTDSRIIGKLAKDALCYVLADGDQEWVYVESEDVRGFVNSEFLLLGAEAAAQVEAAGEETYALATELIKPEENTACYYTFTSIKEGVIASAIRTSMLEYAQQFLGNPYVWGGTDLINGADCSGYVQGIYSAFGYTLPRTSGEQSQYGTQIPVEEAAPGDLIFYAKDGVVYHVVMYMGDGQVIHASSSKTGIITSGMDTTHAVWATRIISDNDTENIEKVNNMVLAQAEYHMATSDQIGDYLGNFKLTAYCNCAQCCGQWAGGPTASGTIPTQGRTVATGDLPFGTEVIINGQLFTVEDRGTPFGHIDIYMNDHNECNEFGVNFANVFLAK